MLYPLLCIGPHQDDTIHLCFLYKHTCSPRFLLCLYQSGYPGFLGGNLCYFRRKTYFRVLLSPVQDIGNNIPVSLISKENMGDVNLTVRESPTTNHWVLLINVSINITWRCKIYLIITVSVPILLEKQTAFWMSGSIYILFNELEFVRNA